MPISAAASMTGRVLVMLEKRSRWRLFSEDRIWCGAALSSSPSGLAQDGGQEPADLGGVGRYGVVAPGAGLEPQAVGALAAGRAAVQPTTPGSRPAQLRATQDAARRSVTKHARFVTCHGAHAIASAVLGRERAATRAAIA
jgi:hypothetical protein